MVSEVDSWGFVSGLLTTTHPDMCLGTVPQVLTRVPQSYSLPSSLPKCAHMLLVCDLENMHVLLLSGIMNLNSLLLNPCHESSTDKDSEKQKTFIPLDSFKKFCKCIKPSH